MDLIEKQQVQAIVGLQTWEEVRHSWFKPHQLDTGKWMQWLPLLDPGDGVGSLWYTRTLTLLPLISFHVLLMPSSKWVQKLATFWLFHHLLSIPLLLYQMSLSGLKEGNQEYLCFIPLYQWQWVYFKQLTNWAWWKRAVFGSLHTAPRVLYILWILQSSLINARHSRIEELLLSKWTMVPGVRPQIQRKVSFLVSQGRQPRAWDFRSAGIWCCMVCGSCNGGSFKQQKRVNPTIVRKNSTHWFPCTNQ